jgi:hypothetical protein
MDLNRHARAMKKLLDSMAGSEKDSTSQIFTAAKHANALLVNTMKMEFVAIALQVSTAYLPERTRVQTARQESTIHFMGSLRVQAAEHAQTNTAQDAVDILLDPV